MKVKFKNLAETDRLKLIKICKNNRCNSCVIKDICNTTYNTMRHVLEDVEKTIDLSLIPPVLCCDKYKVLSFNFCPECGASNCMENG